MASSDSWNSGLRCSRRPLESFLADNINGAAATLASNSVGPATFWRGQIACPFSEDECNE